MRANLPHISGFQRVNLAAGGLKVLFGERLTPEATFSEKFILGATSPQNEQMG